MEEKEENGMVTLISVINWTTTMHEEIRNHNSSTIRNKDFYWLSKGLHGRQLQAKVFS